MTYLKQSRQRILLLYSSDHMRVDTEGMGLCLKAHKYPHCCVLSCHNLLVHLVGKGRGGTFSRIPLKSAFAMILIKLWL